MSVYPLPAQTTFNVINLSWNEPQAFTMGIYDMQGRLLKTMERSRNTTVSANRSLP